MSVHYFSVEVSEGRRLYLAPLTDAQIENSGQEISETDGYFLFERDVYDSSRVEIIAKVVSEEAIFKLRQVFNMK